ncbi:phage head closure protein [Microbulbifer sp. 2205BS26-8]|uniref:phage head closure protein n=1 Tax=Microbulbifer sp. 2205BS26-8 TaxID=3064386 RepID=UPI00273EA441|nr:phage head closure protein [Microbulbifer sp. 2205BS26-8]MDP5211067.1 phage head closure protein [Microbulbifer sp. 2205BS26-8]
MAGRVRIGALRHRVILQTRTLDSRATGAKVENWNNLATVWAEVKPHAARELTAADSRYQETSHQITIRYRAGITSKMRVLFGSRTLQVETVINAMEQNRWLHLLCKEIAL